MISRSCPNCGQPLSATSRYCVNCGSEIPDPTAAAAPASAEGVDGSRVPWRAAEGFGIYFIAIGVFLLGNWALVAIVKGTTEVTIGGELLHEFALLVTLLVWVGRRYQAGAYELGIRGPFGEHISIGLAIGLFGIAASTAVGSLVQRVLESVTHNPVTQPDQLGIEGAHLSTTLLVMIAFMVIVLAPLAEEMFFRGFLFRAMRKKLRPWPAIVLSSAIFAVVHLLPLVMLPIFVLGIIFAWIVERRGSIVPTIVAHMVFNAVGFVGLVWHRV